jgi:hypothetical protein
MVVIQICSGLRCCPVDTPALKLVGVLSQQLRISHTIVRGACIEHIPATQQQQQQTGMVKSTTSCEMACKLVNSSTSSFLLHRILPVLKAAHPLVPAFFNTLLRRHAATARLTPPES